ncbi:hypothetical protein DPMN_029134, partial [Dreissena polymorpha]
TDGKVSSEDWSATYGPVDNLLPYDKSNNTAYVETSPLNHVSRLSSVDVSPKPSHLTTAIALLLVSVHGPWSVITFHVPSVVPSGANFIDGLSPWAVVLIPDYNRSGLDSVVSYLSFPFGELEALLVLGENQLCLTSRESCFPAAKYYLNAEHPTSH